uniref:Putative transmembrane protein n=1 Tax=Escherichia coli O25b:H4-ST131 TaxID=941322 RepID=M1GIG4_ECOLX|nr:putative transmembrane protein [Escherichia coli O25b:H4-ST131]
MAFFFRRQAINCAVFHEFQYGINGENRVGLCHTFRRNRGNTRPDFVRQNLSKILKTCSSNSCVRKITHSGGTIITVSFLSWCVHKTSFSILYTIDYVKSLSCASFVLTLSFIVFSY